MNYFDLRFLFILLPVACIFFVTIYKSNLNESVTTAAINYFEQSGIEVISIKPCNQWQRLAHGISNVQLAYLVNTRQGESCQDYLFIYGNLFLGVLLSEVQIKPLK